MSNKDEEKKRQYKIDYHVGWKCDDGKDAEGDAGCYVTYAKQRSDAVNQLLAYLVKNHGDKHLTKLIVGDLDEVDNSEEVKYIVEGLSQCDLWARLSQPMNTYNDAVKLLKEYQSQYANNMFRIVRLEMAKYVVRTTIVESQKRKAE